MYGLTGFIDARLDQDPRILRRMNGRVANRGPDAESYRATPFLPSLDDHLGA